MKRFSHMDSATAKPLVEDDQGYWIRWADAKKLRDALVGLLGGADNVRDLNDMRLFLGAMPAILDLDKAATINAVQALIDTAED